MEGAKKAAESVKETAANVGASAKSGLDKTKAIVQEKTEKMSARDPIQKDIATQKKEAKINQAELNKLEAREHNAAVKQTKTGEHMAGQGPHHHIGSGTTTTGHPIRTNKGATRTTHAHNPGHY